MTAELVTDTQAAELLSLSRATFHVLVARGEIPRVKIGRSARYARTDIQDFIDRCRRPSATGHAIGNGPAT